MKARKYDLMLMNASMILGTSVLSRNWVAIDSCPNAFELSHFGLVRLHELATIDRQPIATELKPQFVDLKERTTGTYYTRNWERKLGLYTDMALVYCFGTK